MGEERRTITGREEIRIVNHPQKLKRQVCTQIKHGHTYYVSLREGRQRNYWSSKEFLYWMENSSEKGLAQNLTQKVNMGQRALVSLE